MIVPQETYVTSLRNRDTIQIETVEKVAFLRSMPVFSGWKQTRLSRFAYFMVKREIPFNYCFAQEGDTITRIIFVEKGEVRCIHSGNNKSVSTEQYDTESVETRAKVLSKTHIKDTAMTQSKMGALYPLYKQKMKGSMMPQHTARKERLETTLDHTLRSKLLDPSFRTKGQATPKMISERPNNRNLFVKISPCHIGLVE